MFQAAEILVKRCKPTIKMCKPTIKNLLDLVVFKLKSFDNLWNFYVNIHLVAFKINLIIYLESIRIFSLLTTIIIT